MPSKKQHSGAEYSTVTQNDFLSEYFETENTIIVIHFFNENEEEISKQIDFELCDLAAKYHEARFLRINGRLAPFIASKFKIKKFPTVAAIRRQEVIDRLTMSDINETQLLREWLFTAGAMTL